MLNSSQNSLLWKTRGQKRTPNGASIQTDLPTGKQAELVWYFIARKGTRSSAWSDLISLAPITK